MSKNASCVKFGKSVLAKTCTISLLLGLFTIIPVTARAVTPWYAVGDSHTVVMKQDGTVWTMGDNSYGQLGVGTTGGHIAEPSKIPVLSGVVAVAAGGAHSVALKKDGSVWTWGYNGSGQLGNDTTRESNTPLQVIGLNDVKAVAAGSSHILALKQDGTVWAWGNNRLGQLGSDSKSLILTPVQISSLKNITSIAAGGYHTVALKTDGTVWTMGYNGYGQLGNGTISYEGSSNPVQVSGLTDIKAVAAGTNHLVVMAKDHSVWAWGNNYISQLGSGTTSHSATRPVKVQGLGEVLDITAQANHTFAMMKDGSVWAWGDNGSNQWGNGVAMNGSSSPVQMRGVSTVISVAAVGNPETLAMSEGTAMGERVPGFDILDSSNVANASDSVNNNSFFIAHAEIN